MSRRALSALWNYQSVGGGASPAVRDVFCPIQLRAWAWSKEGLRNLIPRA